jgi:hypothetical protein
MRFDQLEEGRNTKCIVIDVQPEYGEWIDNPHEIMQFLNKQGPILMFVNANEGHWAGASTDSIWDIKTYWKWHGFNRNWNDVIIDNKGYGYLRGWMDNIPDSVIIKAIREMYRQDVTQSDDLFDGNQEQFNAFFQTLIGDDEIWFMWEDSISIEWTSVAQLKRFNGAYLMGGGRNECLKEVTLLMNAFNIKYKLIERFIYG